MSSNSFELLENPNRKKIMKEFITTRRELNYEYFTNLLEDDTTRADWHLAKLVEAGFLKRTKQRGYYKLNEQNIQILRNYFGEIVPICLIGGLGQLDLFTDVLEALMRLSVVPIKYILISSPEIHDNFKEVDKGEFSKVSTEFIELDYQSVLRENYPEVHMRLEKALKKEIKEQGIICELTGGTKTVSLALMELSTKYHLKRCYYSGRKIIWL